MRVLHVGKYMYNVATRGCMFDIGLYICACAEVKKEGCVSD